MQPRVSDERTASRSRTLVSAATAVLAAVAAVPVEGALSAAAAAQGVIGTVPGRVGGSMAALVALSSVVAGWLALGRSAPRSEGSSGRDRAIVALVLGVVAIVLAAVHLVAANGGLGTGSGKGGAIVGAVLALIGLALGRRALGRASAAA